MKNSQKSNMRGNSRASRRRAQRARQSNANGMGMIISESSPIARSYRVPSSQPKLQTISGNVTRIRHRELITSINGSANFAATKYEVNPGLSNFPWLSSRASGWEKYRWRRLFIHYVPSNAVTTTPGAVILAADYDPTDAAPSTHSSLSSYETVVERQVHRQVSLEASPKRMFDGVQAKKVRCGPVGQSLQLFDGCCFIVATVDCSNSNAIGKIYFEYEVDLISPQVEPSTPVPPHLLYVGMSGTQALTSTVESDVNFDTAIVEGFALDETDGAVTMPCGTFKISGTVKVNDTSAEPLTVIVGVDLDGVSVDSASFSANITTPAGGGAFTMPFIAYINSDGTNVLSITVKVTGAAGTLTVSPTGSFLMIEAL